MAFLEILKVIFLGIVEGITEWLPISSTGHMLLVDTFLKMSAKQDFKDMFMVVIQLGAILAVVVIYWKKLWPFKKMITLDTAYHNADIPTDRKLTRDERKKLNGEWNPQDVICIKSIAANRKILEMWLKVIIATLPAAVFGIFLDNWMDKHAHTPVVIALMLIIYGVLFIVVENKNAQKEPRVTKLGRLSYLDALKMGLFQVLAIIPGTSRSGSTIIGGLILGISRNLAAEFSFFMSIPVMLGWSIVKLIKFGFNYSAFEFFELIVGMAVAFAVSIFVIRFLMGYIKKHDFKVFGYYRIILGVIVLLIFGIKALV